MNTNELYLEIKKDFERQPKEYIDQDELIEETLQVLKQILDEAPDENFFQDFEFCTEMYDTRDDYVCEVFLIYKLNDVEYNIQIGFNGYCINKESEKDIETFCITDIDNGTSELYRFFSELKSQKG